MWVFPDKMGENFIGTNVVVWYTYEHFHDASIKFFKCHPTSPTISYGCSGSGLKSS